MKMRMHIIIYALFVISILFDLATSILGFHQPNLTETNLIYQIVGIWAFPIVYLIDAGIIGVVEWLRKWICYSPLILLIPILFYMKAGITNLQLL